MNNSMDTWTIIYILIGIASTAYLLFLWIVVPILTRRSFRKSKGMPKTTQELNDRLDEVLSRNNDERINNSDVGDLVPLIWMIESRRADGKRTMNDLIEELSTNFEGLQHIKHRTIDWR